MKKKKLVLDTDNVKVYLEGAGHVVYIKMGDGKWMVNRPHSGDLKGLVAALTLGIDALAGKIWPMTAVSLNEKDKNPSPLELAFNGVEDIATLGDGAE